MTPRIVIVGPGAIGCLLATILAESGHDVVLLDKDPRRADTISRNGIRIDTAGRSRVVPVRAVWNPAAIGVADFVCICVKAYDTAKAIRHARAIIGPRTAVCSFQNGLGNAERIAREVGPARVICAATAQGSTHVAPGHIRHAGSGITTLAPYNARGLGRAKSLYRLLVRSGMEAELIENRESLIWSKLIVNAAINPVTVLAGVPNGELLKRPDLKSLSVQAAREAEQVARAKGIPLLYHDAAAEVAKVCRRTRLNLSSMLQDIRRGKRTEIDAINGAIVKAAADLGISVPANAMLVKEVKRKERRRG